MEVARKVQVRLFPAGGGQPRFGSGYLLAPRLVLTAAHILGDNESHPLPGEVKVSRPDAGARLFPAAVRWYRQDARTDAALIEVDRDADWQVPATLREQELRRQPPQRWGELIGIHKLPVDAVGFPRMQRADDGVRVDEQLTGHIQPGTGRDVHRYEVFSSDPTVARYQNTGSRWSGMSGAAVVCGDPPYRDVLCGVVREVLPSSDGSRLTATPAYALFDHPAFRALLTEHTGWEPVLEPADAVHLLAPATPVRDLRSPAMLLRADVEAVRFEGRDHLVGQLLAWCESEEAFAVQVLTGPAGQGKTRLARHLTARLRNDRWITGHLREGRMDWEQPPDLSGLDTNCDLLLVVDYAERRPLLVRHLIEYLHSARHRTRILLLARADGPWREHSLGAGYPTHDILASAPLIKLGPLHPAPSGSQPGPPEGRGEAFANASSDLARLLGYVMPGADWPALAPIRPPDDLSDPRYDSVLTLQMTALVTLLQYGPSPVEAVPGEPPEATLLRHEARYWEQSAKSRAFQLALPPDTLHRAVATAVLCGAATKKEAVKATRKVSGVSYRRAPSVARWLRSLYPPEPDTYWGVLQPDRVAEFHASRSLLNEGIHLPTLIAASSAGQQARAVTVLARAAIAHYNARRAFQSTRVLRAVETALDVSSLRPEALFNIIEGLPHPSRVVSSLAVRLTAELANTHRALAAVANDPTAHEAILAVSLANLAVRLSESGRREEALEASSEAVGIHRRLAKQTDIHEPGLAMSLAGAALRLLQAGRHEEGLEASSEAVEIYRRLAKKTDIYKPSLAASQITLAHLYSETGRHEAAIKVAARAINIYQGLAEDKPAIYEEPLARSLMTIGIDMSATGRKTKALKVSRRALGIYRHLAQVNPAAHEYGLSQALSSLSNRLSETGRHDEAVDIGKEALRVLRNLAQANPAAYEPALARAILNLGYDLSKMERYDDGLDATREGVAINRKLAQYDPAGYESAFAQSLSNLLAALSEAGREDESLDVTREAVPIYRKLLQEGRADFLIHLANGQSRIGAELLRSGHAAEAVDIYQEAVTAYRQLAAVNLVRYGSDLATALYNFGHSLFLMEQYNEAVDVNKQAVEIARRLLKVSAADYEPQLAQALCSLAALQAEGQRDFPGALPIAEEAVRRYRKVVAREPGMFIEELRTALEMQAALLDEVGRADQAEQIRAQLASDDLRS
ncbi:hypothetical protein GCM10010521_43640 [Streptomyces rameus]|uniref:Tetratricopeptide repeat protein n=1 Tax=Streptomyces rameus TaxID=68261 RepID=A0ABP6NL02_9ACTN